MKYLSLLTPLIFLLGTQAVRSADMINLAEDDAPQGGYGWGWNDGTNSGGGFSAWTLCKHQKDGVESHAGAYVANSKGKAEAGGIATSEKALALYANGVDFESISAFRSFDQALMVGDTFSLLKQFADFKSKFDSDDPRAGTIGLALRHGHAGTTWEDYKTGARLRIERVQGEANFQIFDGEPDHDSSIPAGNQGMTISVTLTSPDRYRLEFQDLQSGKLTKLPERKLAGPEGSQVESFAAYNLDGESADAFFNSFQVCRTADKLGR